MSNTKSDNDFPQRKRIRLKGFDYSASKTYYVTICTDEKTKILSSVNDGTVTLTKFGEYAEEAVEYVNREIDNVYIPNYIIMPDHIHMIVEIDDMKEVNGVIVRNGITNRKLGGVVASIKRYTTIRANKKIWQRLFYDHIVRNEREYNEIWKYIDDNPYRWKD